MLSNALREDVLLVRDDVVPGIQQVNIASSITSPHVNHGPRFYLARYMRKYLLYITIVNRHVNI